MVYALNFLLGWVLLLSFAEKWSVFALCFAAILVCPLFLLLVCGGFGCRVCSGVSGFTSVFVDGISYLIRYEVEESFRNVGVMQPFCGFISVFDLIKLGVKV